MPLGANTSASGGVYHLFLEDAVPAEIHRETLRSRRRRHLTQFSSNPPLDSRFRSCEPVSTITSKKKKTIFTLSLFQLRDTNLMSFRGRPTEVDNRTSQTAPLLR